MRQITKLILAALIAVSAAPAFAAWQDEVNPYDKTRLGRLEESKAKGLMDAGRASGRDQAQIHAVLDARDRPISEHELMGGWQCRTMKLGGLTPDIIYTWFRCSVRQTKGGLYFEKLTGSSRISGYLEPYDGGRFVLLGELTVKNERPKPYSGGNNGAGAPTTSGDAVGVVSGLGAGHARIEFPYPAIESDFDVIELRR